VNFIRWFKDLLQLLIWFEVNRFRFQAVRLLLVHMPLFLLPWTH